MRFRGRLRSPGDPGPGLPVSVILDDFGLTIESNGEKVGTWSLGSVTASRTSSDRFDMSFGDERFLFEADDTLGFSYEALPHIDGRRSRGGMLTKIRTALAPPAAETSIDLRPIAVDAATEAIEVPVAAPLEPQLPPVEQLPPADQCRGLRRDGQPCRSSIVLDSGFCSNHDPNRPARVKTTPVEDPSLAGVFRQLERAVADVRAGRMEPNAAIALAGLARAMCATVDADEALQNGSTHRPESRRHR